MTMKSVRWSVILVMLAFIASSGATQQGCAAKSYGIGKIVCVCNSTYCDTLEPINYLPVGTYLLYTSTKEGLRFHETIGNFNSSPNKSSVVMKVDRSVKYQVIEGFGTAFTDAAGINALSLSQQTQDNFISSYFSPRGIELNIGRVPIAGSDFSTHTYTYNDDREDIDLKKFNLTLEDFTFKIPFIKLAQKQSKSKIKLISAAWTSPPWTKTNDDYSGFGFLKAQYYQYWADYLVRFLDEYKKEGLEFWAISTGNEPVNGIIPINRFNSLGWTPHSQRSWIAENFGPALRKSQHKNIKLLAIDDQRFMLPWWVNILMSDEKAADYIDGIAVHWYWDTMFPPSLLDYTHDNYPNKFLISTEASVGDKPWDFVKVKLGSWARGESYMDDIIQDLTHWVVGWVDWNMALDLKGGPNWAKNHIDSAVIVNTTADEFYKQPMFYALGHFSKFLPEGSVRIGIEPIIARGIKSVAFERPDSGVAIIIYNEKNANTKVTIFDASRGYINIVVKKRSFNTIVYW